MAILKMSKFNLVIFESNKEKVLDSLQNFREVDFRVTDMGESGYQNFVSSNREEIDDKIYTIENTLKRLRRYAISKGAIKALKEGNKYFTYKELKDYVEESDWENLVQKVDTELELLEGASKEIESSKAKISEYSQFENLDISNEDIKGLKKTTILLGTILTKNLDLLKEELKEELVYLEIVSSNTKETVLGVTILNEDEENVYDILRKYAFNKLSIELKMTPSEYIDKYTYDIKTANDVINKSSEKLKILAENIERLEIALEYYKNLKLREVASENFGKTDKLSVVSGYIPDGKKEEFEVAVNSSTEGLSYIEFQDVDRDDPDIPIKFKNGKFSEPFEDLVKTYSMPKYNEVDPTPVVAPFYWIFFGMMVADAGYGLVLFIISGLVLKTFNLAASTKKMVKFVFYLSFSIIIWGMIYGSYFSLDIDVPRLLSPVTDYTQIMIISIVLGIIHIFVGFGMKAYMLIRDGKPLDALLDVGLWYVTLTTVILLLAGSSLGLSESVLVIVKYVMYISMIGIVLTGGRKLAGIGAKVGVGVYTLYGITGYLGDFVSYIRLMAIGLSGGFIAQSVNMICTMIGFKPLTLIFVLIVFLFGQTVNLLLSLLSAYVHSARLIYVEFFSKFYDGGGKEFKDFKIDEKYINIKEEK